ncbi:DoxX family protein [Oxalobacteraceae bacterium OTU3CINTB1]|nr:DoxX family protein [Oxalobacteraceae bacterium OTU3CINTB1]
MRTFALRTWLSWGLVAFFVFAGVLNIVAPVSLQEDYARWGYPTWFHFATGALELTSALLQSRRTTSWAGLTLGMLIMASAVATLSLHREWTHAVFPALILAALTFTLIARSRRLKTGAMANGTSPSH